MLFVVRNVTVFKLGDPTTDKFGHKRARKLTLGRMSRHILSVGSALLKTEKRRYSSNRIRLAIILDRV